MLQQTQVERVKDFFVRFLETFPDVRSLAAAREDRVLKAWEGLGYYRRARQLHAAARRIVADHGGAFPRTADALRSLPGVGRYTANAIASIAFDAAEPIVEANSRRVLARLAGHGEPLDGPGGDAAIWELAATVVPARGAGRFNQALMDLGALICTPTRPRCDACPLAAQCVARATGRAESIPVKAVRKRIERVREMAVVLRHADAVLVERRAAGEWWEGLWDFPREPVRSAGRRLGVVRYTVTHHAVECVVRERVVARRSAVPRGRRWVAIDGLARLAMTAPGRRIAGLLHPSPARGTLRRSTGSRAVKSRGD